MRQLARGGVVALAVLMMLTGGLAHAQTLCETYVVTRGDTLRKIAQRAFGNDDRYLEIYEANRRVIGRSPNLIEIGMALRIPCPEGRAPDAARQDPAAETARPETAPETARPEAPEVDMRLVTTGAMPPFSDAARPGLGLAAELILRAMETELPGLSFEIAVLPDPLEILSRGPGAGTWDLAFPLYRPACPASSAAPETAALLCRDYLYSGPLHRALIGLYVAEGDPRAAGPAAAFEGARICVPAGYLGPDPVSAGMLPGPVTLMEGLRMVDCLASVEDGEAAAMLANPGIVPGEAVVEQVAGLTREADLVIVAPKGSARAAGLLRRLDAALAGLVSDGDWEEIVAGQIASHRQRLGAGL